MLLPLLPRLFAHYPAAELAPILRDWVPCATRVRAGPPWPPLPVGFAAQSSSSGRSAGPGAGAGTGRNAGAGAPEPTDALASGYLRGSRIGRLLPAWLTATAVLVACPPLARSILWELCTTPEVLKGGEKTLLPLLRARCAPAGGLHQLMAYHLEWLLASWLDHCLPLVAFPHHWLLPDGCRCHLPPI